MMAPTAAPDTYSASHSVVLSVAYNRQKWKQQSGMNHGRVRLAYVVILVMHRTRLLLLLLLFSNFLRIIVAALLTFNSGHMKFGCLHATTVDGRPPPNLFIQ